jgi:mono/diheme cytochrome c family protein
VRYSIAYFAIAALPAAAADVAPGKQLFDRHCAECHAPGFGHPGTQQLGWTRGAARAVLEQRKDLVPAYVSAIVRNGLMEMPAFRPTEISDAELKVLADYVANAHKQRKAR